MAMVERELPDPAPPTAVRWQRSYDRAAVEAFLHDVEVEEAKLRAELEGARALLVAARESVAERERAAREALEELAAAARRELRRLDEEHRAAVAQIRAAADAEVARLLGTRPEEAAPTADAAREVRS